MTPEQTAVWDRLHAFRVDNGTESLTFVRRLARENAWSVAYAERVFEEYKRFVFLAMTAGHPVTPSDQVDQAWHLHLTYTRSYWDEWCGKVLQAPLHHNPTKGGPAEGAKFDCWYHNTQESYRRLFGEEPPEDIWPAASIRFGDDLYYQRVNTKRHWIVPKPNLRRLAPVAAVLVGALFITGCANARFDEQVAGLGLSLGAVLWLQGIVLALVVALGIRLRRTVRDVERFTPVDGKALTSYDWAYLAGGEQRVFDTAVVGMVEDSVIAHDEANHRLRVVAPLPADAHPIERILYDEIARTDTGVRVGTLKQLTYKELGESQDLLVEQGLVVSPMQRGLARGLPISMIIIVDLIVLGLGVLTLIKGANLQDLASFFIIAGVMGLFAILPFVYAPRLTHRGEALLAARQRQVEHDQQEAPDRIDLPDAVALLGLTALHATMFATLAHDLKPPADGGGGCAGCGDGGGGGGGCGGGGCGGCGGCGG